MLEELRGDLAGAEARIRNHGEVDREMEVYAVNLKEVGEELVTLNEVLEKKNRECRQLHQDTVKLRTDNNELRDRIRSMDTGN